MSAPVHHGNKNPDPAYIEVAKRCAKTLYSGLAAQDAKADQRKPFSQRGFSERTIDALIARGITYPERLLFASEADLKALAKDLKLSKASREEIKNYVLRFHDQEGAAMNTIPVGGTTGLSHEHSAAIDAAAEWLASTPQAERPHPLVPHIQRTFGLTAIQAIEAIREARLG